MIARVNPFEDTRYRSRARSALKGVALMLLLTGTWAVQADVPIVAVAANLTSTVEAIATRFHADTGQRVRFSFGASGVLARQIIRGAPFELFLSADDSYPALIIEKGLAVGNAKEFASGRLLLQLAREVDFSLPPGVLSSATARSVLTDERMHRLAIANPTHAPYGRAAREVLEYLDIWNQVESTLVMGESVAQTTRFAAAGSVQGALVPRSVRSHAGLADSQFVQIPADWHRPLPHHMVLLKGAGPVAKSFYVYLLGSPARTLLAEYGYDLPALEN